MTSPAAALNRTGDDGHEERVYPIPDADGNVVELPNISSVVDVTYKPWLTNWKIKMALLGVANREDIAMLAVAATHMEPGKARNAELARVAELAITAGQVVDKGYLTNDLGSAVHLLTEALDRAVAS
jgi:hypothetical protein